MHQWFKTSH